MASLFDKLNGAVHNSVVGRFFEFEKRNAKFTSEVRGYVSYVGKKELSNGFPYGTAPLFLTCFLPSFIHSFISNFHRATATFFSMAYILAINPRILADSGGPCVPPDVEDGIFTGEYEACLEGIKREFVTSTAIASMVGCLLMGFFANLPIALAPGMGMNAYFTYNVVGWRGGGNIAYDAAITAVMIEGVVFFLLAVTGVRHFITKFLPEPVRVATPAAIGMFLAHLGLQTAEGIGVVVADVATAVTLGACPEDKRTNMVAYTDECRDAGICVFSDAYTCDEVHPRMLTWCNSIRTDCKTQLLLPYHCRKEE